MLDLVQSAGVGLIALLGCGRAGPAIASSTDSFSLSWQWNMFLNAFGIGHPDALPRGRDALRSPSTEISVIGAGLPRTGTDSLKAALDKLRYHTYHAQTVQPEGHHSVWKELFKATIAGRDGRDEVDRVVEALLDAGYTATTDFPACLIFDHLLERFPEAKVVLSVRDAPEKWAESYGATIGTFMAQTAREPIKSLTEGWMGPFGEYMDQQLGSKTEYGPGRRPTRDSLARAYSLWIKRVNETVSSDRLLVHNSKDGWEPLCAHLGISEEDCPKTPYPHTNGRTVWRIMVAMICFFTDYWPYYMYALPCILFALIVTMTVATKKRFQTSVKAGSSPEKMKMT